MCGVWSSGLTLLVTRIFSAYGLGLASRASSELIAGQLLGMNLPLEPKPVKPEPDSVAPQPQKLSDRVRAELRLRHYSIRTEQAYLDWIKRFLHFHR